MLPTDPKEAAKLGKAWGEVLTDSIFGIVDVIKGAPAQRQAFKQTKIDQAQAAARAERLARESHEENMQIFWLCVVLFVVFPSIVWIGLLVYGILDPIAYYSLKSWVPLLKTIVGR